MEMLLSARLHVQGCLLMLLLDKSGKEYEFTDENSHMNNFTEVFFVIWNKHKNKNGPLLWTVPNWYNRLSYSSTTTIIIHTAVWS